MQPPSELPLDLDHSFNSGTPRREALVQDRPTLGAMPMARRGTAWWLLPGIDFISSSLALIAIGLLSGVAFFPAIPVSPLVLVLVYGLLGVYGSSRPTRRSPLSSEGGVGWPVIRLVVAGLFAWSAALMMPIARGEQLGLWITFLVLDTVTWAIVAPYLQRFDRPERWVLVGDEATANRLRAYAPLREYASVVGTVSPQHGEGMPGRVAALDVVERYHADRIVISSQRADDEGLLELVRAFKSIGVMVCLLPRPLDLLEAPAATPSQVGGVPLIEVEALASRDAVPYTGPDRRANRRTKISVVVPAMNEGKNIGHVLSRLPDNLYEVILVDGNSTDDTVEAAQAAYPGIRVTSQSGRGKGDAFRTGFASVTGNLVVMLDADGSADPAEIPAFVAALEAGADFAKGSRFLDGGGSADITWTRKLGNAFLSGSANTLHGTHFTDLCYGYNAFWARCLPFISLDVPGFEVETLINLRIAGAGMKITEVPSYEEERISGASNLKTFRDGFRVLGTILREARRRRSIHSEPHGEAGTEASQADTTAAAA
ncbi:MAG TPA: glycosyltransferase [Solirubrobacterales bacterium]|nr:glycosyltransferase [Solirubrobacterales bacterium]